MRRWVGWSSLFTLLALVGCGDDSKPSAATDPARTTAPTATTLVGGVVPTLSQATQPPGSPLVGGFTVPPGTVLIGDVFPIGAGEPIYGSIAHGVDAKRDATSRTQGWRGYLLVVGDPMDVVRHFQ